MAAERPRVLLIAPHSSYRIAPYLQGAQQLGLDLVVASQGKHSLVPEIAHGLQIDLAHPQRALELILQAAALHPLAGVIGTDDATVELASRAAQALGLPHNPPEAARLSRRKDLARARLAAHGLPVPAHRRLDFSRPLDQQIRDLRFPCVVKPLALSASRGVIRADDPAQLVAACARIRLMLADAEAVDPEERTQVLVEEYIPGIEVAVEGLLQSGRLKVLAMFDKPDPLEGPYFEETYYITPSRLGPEIQGRIHACLERACGAYGLRYGPVHAELRVSAGEPWILEVAARTIGGQCARLLRFGAGRSLETLVLSDALGKPLEVQTEPGAAGVLMIPIPRAGVLRRVEGVLAAQRVPFIEEVEISVREGYELVPLPEGASYLGFVFARAPTPQQAESALRAAHACLNVITAPVWKLQRS
ncbi:MAG: ATP-grasp domain-containing protein [Gammaproteobacteria bacterium]|nr:ATP-grasp domain-containing protein [Gammaproteobacteria bacterium]